MFATDASFLSSSILSLLFIVSGACAPSSGILEEEGAILKSSVKPGPTNQADYHVFQWQWEPREKAFKVLMPVDWKVDGGIFRIDPTAGGGAANAVEAKLDFVMKKDDQGTAMMRWYPDIYYFDMRHSPAGQMGLFPTGSNYNGMTVMPLMSPVEFIRQVVVPYAHPGATDLKIVKQESLPKLAQAVQREDGLIVNAGFTYSAALAKLEYTDGGQVYEEKVVSVIMNLGQLGAGMWKNRSTFSVRALKGELKEYEPIFASIAYSTNINMQWLVGEVRAQLYRAGIMNKTLEEINRIGQEIASHRQQTNAIIQNDMYLNLTGQEEYVNPYSGEVELGPNLWNHRWSSDSDFVIYSDDPNFDPNQVPELSHFGYKKSPVHKRSVSVR